MSDDLSILPPDKDLFLEKKPVSQKQKLHLEKARLAAKQTIERRRALDIEAKKKLAEEEEKEKEKEEEEEEEEIVVSKPSRKKKEVVLTEEEEEARRFNKFMVNMNKYEKLKEKKLKEIEEAKKIHMSFTPEQHQHIRKLLEQEQLAKKQLKAVDPVKPKPEESVQDTRVKRVLGGSAQVSRFGR